MVDCERLAFWILSQVEFHRLAVYICENVEQPSPIINLDWQ